MAKKHKMRALLYMSLNYTDDRYLKETIVEMANQIKQGLLKNPEDSESLYWELNINQEDEP